MSKYKFLLAGLTILIFAVAVGGIIYLNRGGDVKASSEKESTKTAEYVEIDGVKYTPKQNVEAFLFIGADSTDTVEQDKENGTRSRCDVLRLIVIDRQANTYAVIPISRDTITNVASYDENGEEIAKGEIQLALAREKGITPEQGCENTVAAVSELFLNQKIDGYMSLNMGAIATLNHEVGGVTVTIEDDFSECDPTLVMGETITLNDEQAFNFIRGRKSVGDGTNVDRMRRQEAYMAALKPMLIDRCKQSEAYALQLYKSLGDYVVTNMTDKDISRIAKAILKNEDMGEFSISGELSEDEMGWIAFTPDEKSIEEIVFKLFYNRIN